ncbi:uncharacterized protein LOC116106860 [Pistacia vera]|uniref:uncharacterized protein LOC116106860 n=1 Tax=Pistacia vera TaxID=55513 RepID=UPI001262C894|nr:uncharacterized protein LOC116106860 [Pistacia vera]
MATIRDSITDYSKTQRIVLLIDLNPLLHLQDPEPFLATLLTSTKILISFASLSSSLFAFKFFFSSLSPLLSSSKLPFPSLSLSFGQPETTIQSLNTFLLNPSLKSIFSKTSSFSSPRAANVAASMRQLVHDYAWDTDGKILDSVCVRSNVVVLFSPILKSVKCSSEFLDVDVNDECLSDVGLFNDKFRGFFGSVNDAFRRRDIHLSWVDVKCGLDSGDANEIELKSWVFDCGIRDLGWGFCSSDSIVLGSGLVHFGLIYPIIGVSSSSHLSNFNNDYSKAIRAQLNLKILDVSGKPLECKVSDLELVNMEMFSRNTDKDSLIPVEFMDSQIRGCEKNRFWGHFGDRIIKFHVKAVYKYEEGVNFDGLFSDSILVREFSGESVNDGKENSSEFFADKVLKILAREMGGLLQKKGIPIWQIFLSFLYRRGYWALVSLLNGNGESHMGILKPFTIFSALLSIVDDESCSHSKVNEFGGVDPAPFVMTMDNEICKSNGLAALGEVKRKKKKRHLHLLQDLTWDAFCKAASGNTMIDFEEVYFATECNSKKLKFLKCWMKQIEKSSSCSLMTGEKAKQHTDIPKEMETRLAELPQDSEQPIPSTASMGEEALTSASRIQDDAALDMRSETSESFFSNLSIKMQQGLESEGVDLGALAERLVNSSIYWLYQKQDIENTSESQTPAVKPDDACSSIAVIELKKLLLREPKDLIAMHKNNDPSTKESNPRPARFTSESIVREYELQILFRMEILQSEIRSSIEEPVKQKFVRQICLLLEAIQCHLQGGFFGDWSLDNYVQKIIKDRYCDTLGDTVHRIYTKMDLLLFADEDESPNHLLNSEDSNQSWRDETGENFRVNKSVSLEDESLQLHENDDENPQGIRREEHARKVMEAHERRERARRFASFTSWVPDLQRVWAPKQPKAMKPKSNWKLPKRKDHKSASYDKVCETPMTGNKRSCSIESDTDEYVHQDSGSRTCSSVSKALFQDNR